MDLGINGRTAPVCGASADRGYACAASLAEAGAARVTVAHKGTLNDLLPSSFDIGDCVLAANAKRPEPRASTVHRCCCRRILGFQGSEKALHMRCRNNCPFSTCSASCRIEPGPLRRLPLQALGELDCRLEMSAVSVEPFANLAHVEFAPTVTLNRAARRYSRPPARRTRPPLPRWTCARLPRWR